jgi:hypothetical protein
MDPAKVEIMKELAFKSQGKSLKEVAPILMGTMQKMKEKNLSFSKEESDYLIDILTRDMPPEERAKVEMMKKMIKKRGGK